MVARTLEMARNGGFWEEDMLGIERTTRDRWLLGVCGGIGRRVGWSANIVRLVTILAAAVIPGVSIFMVVGAYVVLGMILPENPEA